MTEIYMIFTAIFF